MQVLTTNQLFFIVVKGNPTKLKELLALLASLAVDHTLRLLKEGIYLMLIPQEKKLTADHLRHHFKVI